MFKFKIFKRLILVIIISVSLATPSLAMQGRATSGPDTIQQPFQFPNNPRNCNTGQATIITLLFFLASVGLTGLEHLRYTADTYYMLPTSTELEEFKANAIKLNRNITASQAHNMFASADDLWETLAPDFDKNENFDMDNIVETTLDENESDDLQ